MAPSSPHARTIADGIPGTSLTEIAGAGQPADVTRPAPVLAALLDHLEATAEAAEAAGAAATAGATTRHGTGMADTAPYAATSTGTSTWTARWPVRRPGLDRRTRSRVTLTALVAPLVALVPGAHHDELATHMRAAVRIGLGPEEIREVLLRSAVCCGAPAADKAFTIADDVLSEHA